MTVAILFSRADSFYKTLPDCDVWDIVRDARKWPGGAPVVAHPPCRAWGELSHMAKPRPDEKQLAIWAVDQIRSFGGVLEHPQKSKLWKEKPLPGPGRRDEWGGWTLPIQQFWFGHRARKNTFLYIVGIEPSELPEMPFKLGEAPCVLGTNSECKRRNGKHNYRPEITKAEREHTPPQLAEWLCEVARRCGENMKHRAAA